MSEPLGSVIGIRYLKLLKSVESDFVEAKCMIEACAYSQYKILV